RVLAAAYGARKALLKTEQPWRNTDVQSLSTAMDGPLRRALLDPDIEQTVVRPAVRALAKDCSTRHELSQLLGLRGAMTVFVGLRPALARRPRRRHPPGCRGHCRTSRVHLSLGTGRPRASQGAGQEHLGRQPLGTVRQSHRHRLWDVDLAGCRR